MAWQRSIAQWKQSELPTSNWRFENPSSKWLLHSPGNSGPSLTHPTPVIIPLNSLRSIRQPRNASNWPTTKQTKAGTKRSQTINHQETIYDKSFLQNVDSQIYGGRLLIFSATYFAGIFLLLLWQVQFFSNDVKMHLLQYKMNQFDKIPFLSKPFVLFYSCDLIQKQSQYHEGWKL